MKLAILDIDGTLTNTSHVDTICFTRAVAETHGVTEIGASWTNCPHVSDSGVAYQIFLDHFKREPTDEDLSPLKTRFFDLLYEHHALDPAYFAEIPGAQQMVAQLAQTEDWVITIATGCWRGSAKMKLAAAGIELDRFPGGFAEDARPREGIVQAAIDRARNHYGVGSFTRIVSVGDGLWDVRTAANLGLNFVGIADGDRAQTLNQAGARHIVGDYRDVNVFFEFLNLAEIPVAKRNGLILG
ncbi:MAG: HAD family hydrolase [Acidobacteria bacterium]|nr:HAD family hydrolase [Acidobacteriota bacterium]